MYIKEIIIEGFKSYAQTTVVNAFDPHFNAITGLNGSGKSNILDSICFVLGISNLSQVRATNLQELIYKGGNAGITKATVSITFDNSDKAQSPPGYHDYEDITVTRQISVGGKHKYLINGQNATAQRVSDLFCSVQLNVNNPNFLIMQGKITKVLNMKPIEILSMIEEAAGTKTYDVKKANSLQTIDKKNTKLNEIERVLREDITPAIEKLKQERSAYLEYQKCEREYLHLHKISTAFQFYQFQEILNKAQANSHNLDVQLRTSTSRIGEINESVEAIKSEIQQIKSATTDVDSNLAELETNLKQQQLETTKLISELNSLKASIKQENKKKSQIEKSIVENNSMIVSKEKKMDEIRAATEDAQNTFGKAELDLKQAQQQYEALCLGFTINDQNKMETIQDQLLHLRNKISEQQTQIKQAEIKMKKAKIEYEKLTKEIGSSGKEYEEKLASFEAQKKLVDEMSNELDKLNFNSSNYEKLNMQMRTTNNEIGTLSEKLDVFYSKFPQLNFEYSNPTPDFDRNKVKGLVCNLFKIKDPKFSTALEIAAGGKLYNLVVDTDQTGKLLLQRGQLKRKVTIIPMNQIKSNPIRDAVLKNAKQLVGADNVYSALSLIEFDPVYRPVMEYVFGTRFICTNTNAAKQCAFDKSIMVNAITLDGDHFDPEGILTGGSRGERVNMLAKLNELKSQIDELDAKRKQLSTLDEEIRMEKEKSIRYTKLKREFDSQFNKLNSVRMNLEGESYHQKKEQADNLGKEIKEKTELIELGNKELATLKQKQHELENKLENQDSLKDEEKKSAQAKIDEAKKFIDKHTADFKKCSQELDTIKLEINDLRKEVKAYEEEIQKLTESIESLTDQCESINEKIEENREKESEIIAEVDKRKESILEKSNKISAKSAECDKLVKEKNALELKIKEYEHKKTDLHEQLSQSNEKIESLLHSNEWIKDERELFGQANSVYDFKKQNIKEVQHRLNEINKLT